MNHLSQIVTKLQSWASSKTQATSPPELSAGNRTFVYTTQRGCSGRNVTPEEASDLLVIEMSVYG